MKKDEIYIKHILDAISTVKDYVSEMDFDAFLEKRLVQDGVIRQLEIIGEASKGLSIKFKKTLNDVPWQDMAGMRNKLIHEYFGVNLKMVWQTIKKDIPSLKKKIEKRELRKN